MEWIILWIVGSIIVTIMAKSRGRSGLGWFLLSFFLLSPVLCAILILVLPRKNLSAHDQMLFDAMTDEQQQRVRDAREARATVERPKPEPLFTQWRQRHGG